VVAAWILEARDEQLRKLGIEINQATIGRYMP
jgi:hypothetical protein